MLKCEICKNEFEHNPESKKIEKYCSKTCNQRAYRLRNKEKFNAKRRAKYKKDSSRIRAENKRGYQKYQKKRIMNQRQYRIDKPEQRIKINNQLRELRKKHHEKWYFDLFCDRCSSEKDIVFHHLDPKTKKYSISKMFKKNSLEILAEMAKCIILCHSCHNTIHANIQWGNQIFA